MKKKNLLFGGPVFVLNVEISTRWQQMISCLLLNFCSLSKLNLNEVL